MKDESLPIDTDPQERHGDKEPLLESPEAVQQYILDELGDTELAQKIAAHPEITAQILAGEGPLSPDFFSMIHAIAKRDSHLAVILVREAQRNEKILNTNVTIVGRNVSSLELERHKLKHAFIVNEAAVLTQVGEIEKTEFDMAVINFATTQIQKIRESCKLPQYAAVPEQVKLLDSSHFEDKIIGHADMHTESALVAQGEGDTPLRKMSTIVHELVHQHAYGAIEIWDDRNGVKHAAIRRRGLNVRNEKVKGGPTFLNGLNEAVTEEITCRLLRDIPEDDERFGEIIKERNSEVALKLEKTQKVVGRYYRPYWLQPDVTEGEELKSPYLQEKQLMYYLFQKIYTANSAHFGTMTQEEADEELFSMLTKGAFTGNILPFGRLFNDTFGRGKFREFGQLDRVEDQKAFLDGLSDKV